MSHLIVICSREPRGAAGAAAKIRRCASLLAPENIAPNEPLVFESGHLAVGVINPVDGILIRDGSVCLGRFFGPERKWWETGGEPPDGTYALFRHDEGRLELLADVFATRPTWYVHTEDLFLAATSQRALVALLGEFVPNLQAVTWMLVSGMVSGQPWDARLQRLRGDSRVVLDRRSWTLRVECRPSIREPLPLSDEEHVDRLREAVLDTCAAMDLPMERWLLPLSGGIDSRSLLLGLLRSGAQPRCVTWGPPSSLSDPASDSATAARLALALGVQHRFCPIDNAAAPLETAMRRFLLASEGQTVDFGGYADGMALWKGFFEDGEAGVVRGDEPGLEYHNHGRYVSELQVRRMNRLNLLSDFPADHPIRSLGLPEQKPDASLDRMPGETLCAWNNRLYEESVCPSQLAPLNTLKSCYIEIVNPLQSRRVAEVARQLPDRMRVHREPLTRVLAPLTPEIPYATESTHPLLPADFPPASFRPAMMESFSSSEAALVFAQPALDKLVAGLAVAEEQQRRGGSLKAVVKAVVPMRVIDTVRPVRPLRLGSRQLAFRAFVATEMARILSRDAALGSLEL
jgi:hypothetical protein